MNCMHIRDFVSFLFFLISKKCAARLARLAYLSLAQSLLAWRKDAGACLEVQNIAGL